jgi:hypothetical protein
MRCLSCRRSNNHHQCRRRHHHLMLQAPRTHPIAPQYSDIFRKPFAFRTMVHRRHLLPPPQSFAPTHPSPQASLPARDLRQFLPFIPPPSTLADLIPPNLLTATQLNLPSAIQLLLPPTTRGPPPLPPHRSRDHLPPPTKPLLAADPWRALHLPRSVRGNFFRALFCRDDLFHQGGLPFVATRRALDALTLCAGAGSTRLVPSPPRRGRRPELVAATGEICFSQVICYNFISTRERYVHSIL